MCFLIKSWWFAFFLLVSSVDLRYKKIEVTPDHYVYIEKSLYRNGMNSMDVVDTVRKFCPVWVWESNRYNNANILGMVCQDDRRCLSKKSDLTNYVKCKIISYYKNANTISIRSKTFNLKDDPTTYVRICWIPESFFQNYGKKGSKCPEFMINNLFYNECEVFLPLDRDVFFEDKSKKKTVTCMDEHAYVPSQFNTISVCEKPFNDPDVSYKSCDIDVRTNKIFKGCDVTVANGKIFYNSSNKTVSPKIKIDCSDAGKQQTKKEILKKYCRKATGPVGVTLTFKGCVEFNDYFVGICKIYSDSKHIILESGSRVEFAIRDCDLGTGSTPINAIRVCAKSNIPGSEHINFSQCTINVEVFSNGCILKPEPGFGLLEATDVKFSVMYTCGTTSTDLKVIRGCAKRTGQNYAFLNYTLCTVDSYENVFNKCKLQLEKGYGFYDIDTNMYYDTWDIECIDGKYKNVSIPQIVKGCKEVKNSYNVKFSYEHCHKDQDGYYYDKCLISAPKEYFKVNETTYTSKKSVECMDGVFLPPKVELYKGCSITDSQLSREASCTVFDGRFFGSCPHLIVKGWAFEPKPYSNQKLFNCPQRGAKFTYTVRKGCLTLNNLVKKPPCTEIQGYFYDSCVFKTDAKSRIKDTTGYLKEKTLTCDKGVSSPTIDIVIGCSLDGKNLVTKTTHKDCYYDPKEKVFFQNCLITTETDYINSINKSNKLQMTCVGGVGNYKVVDVLQICNIPSLVSDSYIYARDINPVVRGKTFIGSFDMVVSDVNRAITNGTGYYSEVTIDCPYDPKAIDLYRLVLACMKPKATIEDILIYKNCHETKDKKKYFETCPVKVKDNHFIDQDGVYFKEYDLECDNGATNTTTLIVVREDSAKCLLTQIEHGRVIRGCMGRGICVFECDPMYESLIGESLTTLRCGVEGFDFQVLCRRNKYFYLLIIGVPLFVLVCIGGFVGVYVWRKRKAKKEEKIMDMFEL